MVGNDKVITLREAQQRVAARQKSPARKAESRQDSGTGITGWLNAKATNGSVLMIAAATVVVVMILMALLYGSAPAPMME